MAIVTFVERLCAREIPLRAEESGDSRLDRADENALGLAVALRSCLADFARFGVVGTERFLVDSDRAFVGAAWRSRDPPAGGRER